MADGGGRKAMALVREKEKFSKRRSKREKKKFQEVSKREKK